MSTLAPEPVRWSWRRWAWIGAAGLLVHLALVFWFGERAQPPRAVAAPEPWLQLAVDPASIRAVASAPILTDPTLFALPSYRGFSGGAWLDLTPAQLPPSEWSELPRWLPLDTNELGRLFTAFVATNKHSGSVLDDLLKPRTTTADILLRGNTVMTQSVLRLEGPLGERRLVAPLNLPSPAHSDVLPDSVVQVRADRDGLIESAILLAGCGVKSLDEQAVTLAKSARFQPLFADGHGLSKTPTPPLTWGKMVFQWYTVPPSATNTTVLKPE